jgi:hypothetical protein
MLLHMPEDSNLHTHLGENLKSLKVIMLNMSLKMFLIALMDRSKLSELYMMWTMEMMKGTYQGNSI